jgi:hypothetical protein
MEPAEFLAATRQLAAAAEILAKAGPQTWQSDAFQMVAFFRQYDHPGSGLNAVVTSDNALFARTAHAALWLDVMSLPRRTRFSNRLKRFCLRRESSGHERCE